MRLPEGYFGPNEDTVKAVLDRRSKVTTYPQIWRHAFRREFFQLPAPTSSLNPSDSERKTQNIIFLLFQGVLAIGGVIGTPLAPLLLYTLEAAALTALNAPRAMNTAERTLARAIANPIRR